jgi:hypothetical protein
MSKSQERTFHLIWFACVIYLTENYVLPKQVPGMVLTWKYASKTADKDKFEVWQRLNSEYFNPENLHG